MMGTDRERADRAFQDVRKVADKDEAFQKKYATLVHKLPGLLCSAGLCQTLHFIHTRDEDAARRLLADLAPSLLAGRGQTQDADALLAQARTAGLQDYLQMSQEARLLASWYRRMVQGVLKIQDASEGEG